MSKIDNNSIIIESSSYLGIIYDPSFDVGNNKYELTDQSVIHFVDKKSGTINVNNATLEDIKERSEFHQGSTYYSEMKEGLHGLVNKIKNGANITDIDIAHSFPAPETYAYYEIFEKSIKTAQVNIETNPSEEDFDEELIYKLFKEYRKSFTPLRNRDGVAHRLTEADNHKLDTLAEKLHKELPEKAASDFLDKYNYSSKVLQSNESSLDIVIGNSFLASPELRHEVLETVSVLSNAMTNGLRERRTYRDYNGHPEQPGKSEQATGKLLSLAKITIRNSEVYESFEKSIANTLMHTNHSAFAIYNDTAKSNIVQMLEHVSRMKTMEEKRNYLQISAQLDYLNACTPYGTSKLSNYINKEAHKGSSLRNIIRDYYHSEKLDPEIKKIGKKDCALITNNLKQSMIYGDYIRGEWSADMPPLEFLTKDGESFHVSPKECTGTNKFFETKLCDEEGNVIFEEVKNISPFTNVIGDKFLEDAISFLPKNTVDSHKDLEFLSKTYSENSILKKDFLGSIGKNIDGVKDNQGRKTPLSEATAWFRSATRYHKEHGGGAKFTKDYIEESQELLGELVLAASLAKIQDKHAITANFDPSEPNDGTDIFEKVSDMQADNKDIPESVTLAFYKFGEMGYENQRGYTNKYVTWGDDIHTLTNTLRKQYGPKNGIEWEPATSEKILGHTDGKDIVITPLHRYQDIVDEGNEMSHCAGSYAGDAMSGSYYLWSIQSRSPNGETNRISTLGMTYDEDGLSFDQHFGEGNSSVPDDIESKVQEYVKDVGAWEPDDDYFDEDDYDYDNNHMAQQYQGPREDFTATSYQGEVSPHDTPSILLGYDITSQQLASDAFEKIANLMGQDGFSRAVDNAIEILQDPSVPNFDHPITESLVDSLNSARRSFEHSLEH